MQRAKQETGLPIITEVASAAHVELCLKHDFDMLWIGARTTVNPFSVQEIAEALRGVDIPIFVKNPLNPDLQLWIGALERIHRAGVKNLATIHRGFSHYGKSMYRNQPMWEIPIALRTLFPEMPIFCDPSHICGRRDILAQVAQKALDLGMDGLMLESHITPDEAWSDAKQQVTPLRLEELVRNLNVRSASLHDVVTDNDLHALRAQIDKIDEDILHLIANRLSVSEEIGRYKKEHQITILQVDRWKEIVQTRTEWANELGLTPDFIEKYLEQLHKESIRRQTHVMNDSNNEEPSSTDRTDGTSRLV
jgi:chorismate mutase